MNIGPDGKFDPESNEYTTGTGKILSGIHTTCATKFCVIHNPSNHSMRAFPTHWRSDRAMMERICPHGVGHPDPDDCFADGVHGCDGCCQP